MGGRSKIPSQLDAHCSHKCYVLHSNYVVLFAVSIYLTTFFFSLYPFSSSVVFLRDAVTIGVSSFSLALYIVCWLLTSKSTKWWHTIQ